LIEKENTILKMKEAFGAYKTELSADIKSNIDREVETIDPKMKAKANFYKSLGSQKHDVAALSSKMLSSQILSGALKGMPKYKNIHNEKYIEPNISNQRRANGGGIAEEYDTDPDNYDDLNIPTLREEVAMLH
jgi:hypothetical protein